MHSGTFYCSLIALVVVDPKPRGINWRFDFCNTRRVNGQTAVVKDLFFTSSLLKPQVIGEITRTDRQPLNPRTSGSDLENGSKPLGRFNKRD
ncbi:hypothetical protein D9M68_983540 [compost metagenome]